MSSLSSSLFAHNVICYRFSRVILTDIRL